MDHIYQVQVCTDRLLSIFQVIKLACTHLVVIKVRLVGDVNLNQFQTQGKSQEKDGTVNVSALSINYSIRKVHSVRLEQNWKADLGEQILNAKSRRKETERFDNLCVLKHDFSLFFFLLRRVCPCGYPRKAGLPGFVESLGPSNSRTNSGSEFR